MTEQDLLAAIAAAKTPVSEGYTIAELAAAAGRGKDWMRRQVALALEAGTIRQSQKVILDSTGREQVVIAYVTVEGAS